MELSPTGRVILGFLAVEPRSGYDIKEQVDKSTRFFWAASYGQIYPELKRLAGDGLRGGGRVRRASAGGRSIDHPDGPRGPRRLDRDPRADSGDA